MWVIVGNTEEYEVAYHSRQYNLANGPTFPQTLHKAVRKTKQIGATLGRGAENARKRTRASLS